MGQLIIIDIPSVRILSLIILGVLWWVVIHRWRVAFNHTHDLDRTTVLVYVDCFRSWLVTIRNGRIFRTRIILLVSCTRIVLVAIWCRVVPWIF